MREKLCRNYFWLSQISQLLFVSPKFDGVNYLLFQSHYPCLCWTLYQVNCLASNLLCLSICYLLFVLSCWLSIHSEHLLLKTQSVAIVDHFLDLTEWFDGTLSPNQLLFTAYLLCNRHYGTVFYFHSRSSVSLQYLYYDSVFASIIQRRKKDMACLNLLSVSYVVPKIALEPIHTPLWTSFISVLWFFFFCKNRLHRSSPKVCL